MDICHNLRVFLGTSWPKTIYFNLHYFGRRGVRLPVIVSRKFKLKKMKGTVELSGTFTKRVFLGRDDFGWMAARGYWCNEGQVRFDGPCYIGNGTRITVAAGGMLRMGENLYLSGNDLIICRHCVTLGGDSMLSWNVTVMDSDLHQILDERGCVTNPPSPVLTGEHTWIGFDCKLLKGAQVAPGSIVAAGSTITKAFYQENTLLGGTNRELRSPVFWKA